MKVVEVKPSKSIIGYVEAVGAFLESIGYHNADVTKVVAEPHAIQVWVVERDKKGKKTGETVIEQVAFGGDKA